MKYNQSFSRFLMNYGHKSFKGYLLIDMENVLRKNISTMYSYMIILDACFILSTCTWICCIRDGAVQ